MAESRSIFVRLRAEVSDYKRAMREASKATEDVAGSVAKARASLSKLAQSSSRDPTGGASPGGAGAAVAQ